MPLLKNCMDYPCLCRDCFQIFKFGPRCSRCNSPRIVSHKNLLELEIAHIDCDAFYASIEKKENPKLQNLPVIVGGNDRGVVTTCCYIARISGVRSAMPIFKAKKLCPDAVIIAPRMTYYKKISDSVKKILLTISPQIEFVSLDEAYIDLRGTFRLHGEAPAIKLAKISKEIESQLGLTISIGLSYNKFLSKIGSEIEKPRGFSVIGQSDSKEILKNKSISTILGIGKKTKLKLESNGINLIGDLLKYDKTHLTNLLGSFGETLWFLSRGIDNRLVTSNKRAKSISCEMTFQTNQIEFENLKSFLWDLSEKLSSRLKVQSLEAGRISLKLKTTSFKLLVKSITLEYASDSPELIFQASVSLLKKNMYNRPFRLIGLTASLFSISDNKSWNKNFFDKKDKQLLATEEAIDEIRAKFGKNSIIKGRAIKNVN